MNSAPQRLDAIAGLEPLLQASARLQIMAVLSHAQDAEFARLKDVTGSSDSVMSKHLALLSEAGLIKLRKAALEGRAAADVGEPHPRRTQTVRRPCRRAAPDPRRRLAHPPVSG